METNTSSLNMKFQHNSFVSLCVSGCDICNFEGDAGDALLCLSKLPFCVILFVLENRKYFYFHLQYLTYKSRYATRITGGIAISSSSGVYNLRCCHWQCTFHLPGRHLVVRSSVRCLLGLGRMTAGPLLRAGSIC